jgi:predicted TIM-barrel fold metal-dependent hydrolase
MSEMSKSFPVFDCDAHVVETLAIYDYLKPEDRALVRDHGVWADPQYAGVGQLNGKRPGGGVGNGSDATTFGGPGMNPKIRRKLRQMQLTEEQNEYLTFKGAFQPDHRVRELDLAGIDQVLVIPTMLNAYFPFVENIYAARALAQAYNDWAFDYCSYNPERLYGAALLPYQQPTFAAEEVFRLAKRGFPVGMVRPIDANGGYPNSPACNRLWWALEETGMVCGMHTFPAGSFRTGGLPVNWETGAQHSPGELIWEAGESTGRVQGMRSQDLSFMWEAMTWLNGVLLSGFLDRFPKLKMTIFESSAAWLPMLLEECDKMVKYARRERRAPLKRLPSEAFREQCYISFESDEAPVYRMWEYFADIGIWASDEYHHDAEDAWEAIAEMQEAGVPEAVQAKLLSTNAARCYGIEPKLFVTQSNYAAIEASRPSWWPSEAEIAAAQTAEAGAEAARRLRTASYGLAGVAPPTLHEKPQQFRPYVVARPATPPAKDQQRATAGVPAS